MKSQYLQKTVRPGRARRSEHTTLPAPFNGWMTAESPLNRAPGSAEQLDNYFPTRRGVRLREGSRTSATISLAGDPVESLISYNAPLQKRIFAASRTAIYDITSVASPTTPPVESVSGQTSGYYSFVNFTTSGGPFLIVVNGTDPLLHYEPVSGWKQITGTSSPAITGGDTRDLEHVWVYKGRVFFIQARSLVARYLPVGSIAGELGTIDLNGVFQKGGSLVFGGSWSMTAGDGLDDKCIFVTDQGEVAVFQGADPGTANAWAMVGRYEITPPMGRRATMRLGGDLAILAEQGMVPLSAAINKDPSQLSAAAVSRAIEPEWRAMVAQRRTLPWEIIKNTRRGYAIVSLPVTAPGQDPVAFVVNTETGKWCRYTNWDVRCMVLHNDNLYFGTSDGRVKLADVGGTDDGAGIYYTLVSNPETLGDPASVKTIHQARAVFESSTPYIAKISASMDYRVSLPSPPNSAQDVQSNEWDTGQWDVSLWDGPEQGSQIGARWISIGRTGSVLQYQVQMTGALTPAPNTEFISLDLLFERGGTAV